MFHSLYNRENIATSITHTLSDVQNQMKEYICIDSSSTYIQIQRRVEIHILDSNISLLQRE
jgi:hypothetical protein